MAFVSGRQGSNWQSATDSLAASSASMTLSHAMVPRTAAEAATAGEVFSAADSVDLAATAAATAALSEDPDLEDEETAAVETFAAAAVAAAAVDAA